MWVMRGRDVGDEGKGMWVMREGMWVMRGRDVGDEGKRCG